MFWEKFHVKSLLNSGSQTLSLADLTGLGFVFGSMIHLNHFFLYSGRYVKKVPCAPPHLVFQHHLLKCSQNFKGEFSNWSGTCGSGHLIFFLLAAYYS